MAIVFSIKRFPREEHPLKGGAVRLAGGKGEQRITAVYIPGRGWVARQDGGLMFGTLTCFCVAHPCLLGQSRHRTYHLLL